MYETRVPVTLVTGFPEGGKTTAVRSILERGLGNYNGITVLIDTEEDGIEQYPKELLLFRNVAFFDLDGAFALTEQSFAQIEETIHPTQVFIEYNCLFDVSYLDGITLPDGWAIERQMAVFDGSVFRYYLEHQEKKIADMCRRADLILMNRCRDESGQGDEHDRERFRDYFSKTAPQAEVVFQMEE